MPRFYVEHNGEWNIFSTVVDDFLFDEFVCLDALKARLLYERYKELTEDIDSLLTDRPKVNVMPYEEAVRIADRKTEPFDKDINVRSKDEPQTDTEIAKAIIHKMIDDAVIAEDAYPDLRQKMHDAVDEYEPQTDCPWK